MTITCVREAPAAPLHIPAHIYESEVARRWYALPPGAQLPLSDGETCRLLFAGHPGSAAGPDVLDAVIHFPRQEQQCVGAVEFHVRASDWYHHQHQSDARYNNVILHVVLICDQPSVVCQAGRTIPMCSLNDFATPRKHYLARAWPCQQLMRQLGEQERSRMLKQAGLLRFEQKAHAFVELLHTSFPRGPFSAYDVCLIIALAEGLGYGRDRAFFRAAGQFLLGMENGMPEPLGRTIDPPPLDRGRLRVLGKLVEQWKARGAWQSLRKIVSVAPDEQAGAAEDVGQEGALPKTKPVLLAGKIHNQDHLNRLQALRGIFYGLGTARADILICNIVLPFAVAVALIEQDTMLAEEAEALYTEYPGLSSNRITRAMSAQLQLTREPKGACEQQGLHYIYQQTCQEKRCEVCMMGERLL
ncbi:MAG TPA: DUF2851 family protein [Ktedonobacteraceae bacterium]